MVQADILRVLIIFLSLTAPVLIIVRNHHKRHRMNWGDVLIRLGVGVTFVAVAYSTAESFIQGLGPGTRLYVLLGALVWVNVGLLVSIFYDRKMDKLKQPADEWGDSWI
jgi:hypothetical protein